VTERNYEEVDRWRREHASIDWVLLAQGRLNPSQHPNLAAAQRLCADGIQKITAGQQANECRLGIEEVKTAPHSPWQNPFAERLVGSIRRECLDHVIVLSEAHLLAILKSYFSYYHRARTHSRSARTRRTHDRSSYPAHTRSWSSPR
jgi:transposase InsO family protein